MYNITNEELSTATYVSLDQSYVYWMLNNEFFHRENGPAEIITIEKTNSRQFLFYLYGQHYVTIDENNPINDQTLHNFNRYLKNIPNQNKKFQKEMIEKFVYNFSNNKMDIIYWTKKGRFETNDVDNIPWNELHSPNDLLPAYVYYPNNYKEWRSNAKKHRLTGPAIINPNGKIIFYLDGIKYNSLEEWLSIHPNQSQIFKKEMIKRWN
jgi:hypothetical protein